MSQSEFRDDPERDPTLTLALALMRRRSVTPADAGCQTLLAERLRPLGFEVESMRFGPVDNLWAVRGTEGPLLVFAGHTDVVPAGPLDAWSHDPFEPRLQDGLLCGRGAADMKGSLAAMIVAVERFCARHPEAPGRIGFLITSDEEGEAVDGTVRVMAALRERGEHIDWCVVGEPSSEHRVGDRIRVGRRGSLNARLTVRGVQGHVAYPEQIVNPIHGALAPLARLAAGRWDAGNADFPPTSMQISNVTAGTGATNVVPASFEALFNFRFSPERTAASLQAEVEGILDASGIDYSLDWTLSGEPFHTRPGPLIEHTLAAIESVTGIRSETSTGGGTSDGRFIAPAGVDVIELGPVNETIHKVDERIAAAELIELARIHESLLERLFVDA